MINRRKKVVIRADGNEVIGMGHIVRTSVIADELKKYVDIEYVSMQQCRQGIEFLKEKDYKVTEVNEENLIQVLVASKADAIITDSYSIDTNYIEEVKKLFLIVGYIIDDSKKALIADFILNQNFRAEKLIYKVNQECDLLLGSKFTLLREEFRKCSPIKINNKVNNVFVTVGGGDPNNWMEYILNIIYQSDFIYHIIIGPGFPHKNEIKDKYRACANIIFYEGVQLSKVMTKCDIAISTCGSTLYELGGLGVPTIGISIADNQLLTAKKMNEEGCICYLGDIRREKKMDILECIEQLAEDKARREKMQYENLRNINNRGVLGVVNYILDKL